MIAQQSRFWTNWKWFVKNTTLVFSFNPCIIVAHQFHAFLFNHDNNITFISIVMYRNQSSTFELCVHLYIHIETLIFTFHSNMDINCHVGKWLLILLLVLLMWPWYFGKRSTHKQLGLLCGPNNLLYFCCAVYLYWSLCDFMCLMFDLHQAITVSW